MLRTVAVLFLMASLALAASDGPDALDDLGGGNPLEDMFGAELKSAREAGTDVLLVMLRGDAAEAFRKDVLDSADFKRFVTGKYALLVAAAPSRTATDNALVALRVKVRDLMRSYRTQHAPTILALDGEGRAYGRLPIGTESTADIVKGLEAIHLKKAQREALIAKARDLALQRAKLLDEMLSEAITADLPLTGYQPVAGEIISLDGDNKAGLRAKYETLLAFDDIEDALMNRRSEEAERLLQQLDRAKLPEPMKAKTLLYDVVLLGQKGDVDGARKQYEAIAKFPEFSVILKQRALLMLGRASLTAFRTADAETWLNEGLKLGENTYVAFDIRNALGRLKDSQGGSRWNGKAAPELSLNLLTGGTVSSGKAERARVLYFWNSGHAASTEGLAKLAELGASLKDKADVFAVNTGESLQNVVRTALEKQLRLNYALDTDREGSMKLGLVQLPAYIILDKDGTVRASGGALDEKAIEALGALGK